MEIRFPRPDGKESKGYLAMPDDGEKSPGVVIIHEWWGLNDQTRNIANRLSEMGFRALVPDLYGGKGAEIGEADKANKLMGELKRDDAVNQTIAPILGDLNSQVCVRQQRKVTRQERQARDQGEVTVEGTPRVAN